MQFLRQNTAVIVSVGPFFDKTDGVTLETALTITNERITLVAETDDGSAPTNVLDNVTGATSGTSNDLNYITGNDAAMMQLELTAADTNRVGRMRLIITDAANHVPVFHEYTVLPTIVYDSLHPAAGAPIPLFGILDWGTAQTSAAGTLVHRSGLSLANDIPNGSTEFIYSGTGAGQSRVVHDFVGATDTASISPDWTTTPSTDSLYATFGSPPASTSAPMSANVTQIGGDSQSATDLKDFADAGYDPSTNKVQGVVLVDTATTLTNLPAITANWLTAAGTAGDFTTEIQNGLATAAALATVAGYLDTEIAAILALLDDARGEPGQGSPPVNPDLATKIDYLYKAWRNRSTQTATEYALYADDGTTKDQEAACSDDGTTFVRGEVATGA